MESDPLFSEHGILEHPALSKELMLKELRIWESWRRLGFAIFFCDYFCILLFADFMST
jgi:hypothetical protein